MNKTLRYPEAKAEVNWEKERVMYSILKTTMGHYCGYVRFADKPVKEPGPLAMATPDRSRAELAC